MKKLIQNIFNLPSTVKNFLLSVIRELKYVSWLKPSDVLKFSLFVIFVTLLFSAITTGLDSVFVEFRNYLFTVI